MDENLRLRIVKLLAQHRSGVTQATLARALGVSKSYLSAVIRELEKQGIIYRIRLGNSYIVKLAQQEIRTEANPRVIRLGIVWSSEYLFLAPFAKILRDKLGIYLHVSVYPSATQATLALIRGEIDAVLSPLVTQIYAFLFAKNLVIAGGGARGGAAIYTIPNTESSAIASSELSTMDLCRALAMRRGIIDAESTRYFRQPDEAIAMAKLRKVKYVVVWHPLTHSMERLGMKRIAMCSEFTEIGYCCTLALSRTLDTELMEKISKIYSESIELFRNRPELYLDWYSAITGIDTATLRKAVEAYSYEPYLDTKRVILTAQAMRIEVPDIRTLILDAIL